MRYALNAEDRPGETLFEVEGFTQRLVDLYGQRCDATCDEILYVIEGAGSISFGEAEDDIRPGTAIFVSRDTPWQVRGDARAVSVLVHDPEPSTGHAVLDLDSAESETATAGRSFLLGATPDTGSRSATQFIGLIPPGRAPDHFHRYDEVIYVLDGEGVLEIGGEQARLRRGSCVHLPRTLVHCLANPGPGTLRVLGVFRPAGSPAEAYYPDGTSASVPGDDD